MKDFSSQEYVYMVEVYMSHVIVCVCVLGHEVFYCEHCLLIYDWHFTTLTEN